MTSAAGPTYSPRALVGTPAAAESLRINAQQLHGWADAGIVTPAHVDADGSRWWNLHDLRRELAAYLDDHPDEGPRR